MLKIEIKTIPPLALTFDFKAAGPDVHNLVILQNESRLTKSEAWHGQGIKNHEVLALEELLVAIKSNRYSGGGRVISDGTVFDCQGSFGRLAFQYSEEGHNSRTLVSSMRAICSEYVKVELESFNRQFDWWVARM